MAGRRKYVLKVEKRSNEDGAHNVIEGCPSKVVRVAQGCYGSSCTSNLLDIQGLGNVAGDYRSCFGNLRNGPPES